MGSLKLFLQFCDQLRLSLLKPPLGVLYLVFQFLNSLIPGIRRYSQQHFLRFRGVQILINSK